MTLWFNCCFLNIVVTPPLVIKAIKLLGCAGSSNYLSVNWTSYNKACFVNPNILQNDWSVTIIINGSNLQVCNRTCYRTLFGILYTTCKNVLTSICYNSGLLVVSLGSLYSVEWTTGMDYWNGLLECPI